MHRGSRGQQQHHDRDRQRRHSGSDGVVLGADLELQDEEEQHRAEGAVHQQGHQIGGAERARAEHRHRRHRARSLLEQDERDPGDNADHDPRDQHRDGDVAPGGQEVRRHAERHDARKGTAVVEVPRRVLVLRLGHPHAEDQHQRAQGQVDREHPAPACVLDQEAAEERADRHGDTGRAGPRADGRGTVGLAERGLDDRERTGCQEGSGGALQHPEDDQLHRGLRERAERAADGESRDPDQIGTPASQPVPQRAADQDQRGEAQQIAVRDPLEVGERGPEVVTDVAKCDVHDGAVEHGDARPQRDREEGQATEGGAPCEEPVVRLVWLGRISFARRHDVLSRAAVRGCPRSRPARPASRRPVAARRGTSARPRHPVPRA